MNEEINKAIKTPVVRARFKSEEIETAEMTPDELTKFIQSEILRWAPVAKKQKVE